MLASLRLPACRLLLATLTLLAGGARSEAPSFTSAELQAAVALRAAAADHGLAYELVDSLVTEVGARPAGSLADARAVDWALARLKALGFSNVRAEPVPLRAWKRGEAHAHITAPYPHPLVMTALGNSVATANEGLHAEIAYYPDLEALKADGSERAKGRIVFIDQKTERTRDARGYGRAVAARAQGTVEAAKRGALAVAIRSIGTDRDRLAHTGATRYAEGISKVPALAVSVPDADLISRLQRYGQPVRMHLVLRAEAGIAATSHNVIGEIPGAELAQEVVLLGAHLDSWDLGPGALDDGAGVGIVTAAAKLMLEQGLKPRRTVRVVLFANEENGFDGALAYAEKYKSQVHQFVGESDLGAGLVYRLRSRVRPEAVGIVAQIAQQLAPLGIAPDLERNEATPGPDAALLMRRLNWPALELSQDGSDYFDWHHTPNDTLDKIEPTKLRQNVAAWAVMAWLAAQSPMAFGPMPAVPVSATVKP
ncbi:M20/M25/M40 family metallo-hydrolase [Paucibacter sp. PLA-PC-4]|uniref:M20/M25/M40 family metallo-hydrolase n=1 Tax=Paucibacter sp. PLA-PC-4 TaxID=2993655 RepID=UPI002248D480|nr:M20/M25/M40 family metallo-hydrolase [Paucibacter sp. PLA-PC-4]MCX2862158.1 M20/M25/M40 family metallo-hydrolase [Paucibacter sp. PLA-PC-4]